MSTKQIKIILGVLAVIFFFSAFFIYKSNASIDTNNKFIDEILDLQFIDNEINYSLSNSASITNYDNLNADINLFDENLSELSMLSYGVLLFHQSEIKKYIQDIKETFNQKAYLARRANYVSSSINSYMLVSQYEVRNLNISNKLEPIFYVIKGALALDPTLIDNISNQLKTYKNEYKNDAKAQIILDKMLYATQHIKTLKEI